MPALGARAGVEWLTRRWLFESVQLSVTGIVDVSRKVFDGDMAGTVYGTVSTGLTLPAR